VNKEIEAFELVWLHRCSDALRLWYKAITGTHVGLLAAQRKRFLQLGYIVVRRQKWQEQLLFRHEEGIALRPCVVGDVLANLFAGSCDFGWGLPLLRGRRGSWEE
jgi:hypothetical protein